MTGDPKQYIRAGRIHFDVDGEPVTLTVFADKATGKFFLPFKDSTAGEECYSVGRYLDPKARPDGKLVVVAAPAVSYDGQRNILVTADSPQLLARR